MKNKNIVIATLSIILLCIIISIFYLNMNKQNESDPFKISVNNNEILARSKEGYNSIEVYQQNNVLIINAKSEADFFDGAQFTAEADDKINPTDVEIIWTTLEGETEKSTDNDRIIGEIIIKENGEVILDKKVNFMKKALDAVKDVLEKNKN